MEKDHYHLQQDMQQELFVVKEALEQCDAQDLVGLSDKMSDLSDFMALITDRLRSSSCSTTGPAPPDAGVHISQLHQDVEELPHAHFMPVGAGRKRERPATSSEQPGSLGHSSSDREPESQHQHSRV